MQIKHFITLVLILALTTSCYSVAKDATPSKESVSSYPTVESGESLIPYGTTSEIPASHTPESTSTLQAKYSYFDDIESGQYLLVQSYEASAPFLNFVTVDGQIVKKISEDAFFWSTSNDGTRILIVQPDSEYARQVNLLTREWTDLKIKTDCYEASWSPDGNYIALACWNGSTIDIYVLDVGLGYLTRVTDCLEEDLYCSAPSWSYNGQWLAYLRIEVKSGAPSPNNGVFVFDTSCIKNNNCAEDQIGPFGSESNPTWSRANLLITSKDKNIQLYDVGSNSSVPVEEITTAITDIKDAYMVGLYNSPDGMYLAYEPAGNQIIYMFSWLTGTSEVLLGGENITIVGWLVIR